jgi:site-specific DNA-methyltransferase (adenine-specific)
MSDHSVDCFICDLPYGQLTQTGSNNLHRAEPGKQHIKRNDNTNVRGCPWDVRLNLEEFWTQVKRLCRDEHTPVLMFCNTKFGVELINSNPSWFRCDLVWNKQRGVSFLSANKMPMKSHEMIYVFSKKGTYYKRVDVKGEFTGWARKESVNKVRVYQPTKGDKLIAMGNDGTHRCALSVIDIKKPNTLGHPTEKPKDLYRWLLERYCPADGTVLDPTAGSFNAIAVARDMGLHGIGMEKDKGFFDTAVQKFNNQPAPEPAPPTNEIISP